MFTSRTGLTSLHHVASFRRSTDEFQCEPGGPPTVGDITKTILILLLLAGALVLSFTLVSHADGARSNSNSRAEANSASGSYAGGGSVTYNYAEGAASATYAGAYDVRTVPSVSAPGIITGNSCALGTSAGASGLGWGAAFGGTHLDRECNLRAEAGALQAVAGNRTAILHLARDPEMCQTLRASGVLGSGTVCPDERRRKVGPTKSTKAVPTRVAASGYSKCELNNGKIVMSYTAAGKKNKAAAQTNCKRALGF